MNDMLYHNYIDKWTCIGMMNKNCSLLPGGQLGFTKKKDGSKVAAFSLDYKFDPGKHAQVSWLYLDEQPGPEVAKSSYSLEEIVSKIEPAKWFWGKGDRPEAVLAGKSNVEWRGTVNKWTAKLLAGEFQITPLSKENAPAVLQMIEKWRYLENGGMKYGWQERAGCDKALVKRYIDDFEGIQNATLATVFWLNNEVVGYSCIEFVSGSDVDGIPEFKYLTRKVLNTPGRRNLTEFIDYKTIELVHHMNPALPVYLINWGASGGGVHWYKSHKFPLYSAQKKWFCSRNA